MIRATVLREQRHVHANTSTVWHAGKHVCKAAAAPPPPPMFASPSKITYYSLREEGGGLLSFDFSSQDIAPCMNTDAFTKCLDPAKPVPCGSGCIGYGEVRWASFLNNEQARELDLHRRLRTAAGTAARLSLGAVRAFETRSCCPLPPPCSAARPTPSRERCAPQPPSATLMAGSAVSGNWHGRTLAVALQVAVVASTRYSS